MNETREPPSPDVARTLELTAPAARRRRLRRWLLAAAALAAVIALAATFLRGGDGKVRYRTAKLVRGDLTVTVTATGTLQPTNQVDVGSELSGIVKRVEVDYNDRVKVGQVLARLDTTKLEAQILQSAAALRAAQARVSEAEANENELRRKLARARELFDQKFVSEEALIAAQAAAERAAASVRSARSQVDQAQALLEVDRTNLAKSVIRSPIDGTVLARKVEPGQTVAATLQAPVLFTLAEDLTKMELHVDVDEADIGEVKPGQAAKFTVAAYPDREFPSTVAEVRNAAKTVSGVVTYQTVLAVDNVELLLRPGMTGTAAITVSELRGILLVPNAALRFTPPAPAIAEKRSLVSRLLPMPPRRSPDVGTVSAERRHQRVWTLVDGKPVAVPVTVGATDGLATEIVSGTVRPGFEVLVDTLPAGS